LDENNRKTAFASAPAPALSHDGLRVESDASKYLETTLKVIEQLGDRAGALPMGISSQRSTFLIWDKSNGKPLTPLISWQDRRAAGWCEHNHSLDPKIKKLTGLVLSPHYLAPKLKRLLDEQENLKTGLLAGQYLIGTLETFFLWKVSLGKIYLSDHTMAARTLLVELGEKEWSGELIGVFGLEGISLPKLELSAGLDVKAGPFQVKATLSDQASAAVACLARPDWVLVNLGTGGFVLRLYKDKPGGLDRYLLGPALVRAEGTMFAAEGTINALAEAVKAYGNQGESGESINEGLYCIPDSSGIGAPHWRPDISKLFSIDPRNLSIRRKQRAILEGILFRVKEIVDDMIVKPEKIVLSGGLSNYSFLKEGMASLFECPVGLFMETDASLLGAARLAGGFTSFIEPHLLPLSPNQELDYLKQRYRDWKSWVMKEMGSSD